MNTKSLFTNFTPVFLQNIAISLYGYKIRKTRYGGLYKKYLNEICNLDYSKKCVHEFQQERLKNLILYSYQHVPYYKSHLDKIGVKPNSIDINNFQKYFPILEKNTVREKQEYLYSREYLKRDGVYINTSGTSGTPLKILASKHAIQKNYAFFNCLLKKHDIVETNRSATFAGRIFLPKNLSKPPFWRYNYAMNTMLCSSYHINDNSIPHYIAALEKWDPEYIDSYPSAIQQVASYIVKNKIRHKLQLKAIVCSSETLTELQRILIHDAFGCRIIDQYGCAEMAVEGEQLDDGRYFLNPYYSLIEVLNTNGDPVEPGEKGDLVCTGFLNEAMPLIRYRIGDFVKTSIKDNETGAIYYLDEIEGRIDDIIITPKGNRVGRMDPVFKGINDILETQIIQKEIDKIEVKIVKTNNYSLTTEKKLNNAIRERLGEDIKIIFDYVDKIDRNSNGKFKSVVSYLK